MSGLPQSYGVAFPSAGGNAYPPSASTYAATSSPHQQQQQVSIQPGAITYTTSALPDGRIQYNQFRAESRSYQTPQGPVHGIQWVPVNISYELPQNAQPAGPDFHAAWSRPSGDKDSQKMMKEWQRDQEKRARKEEKEAARRMKEWERDRREREKAEEKELRRAQERDMQREPRGRERRHSNVGMGGEYYTTASASVRARSQSRVRRQSAGQDELTRQMAEMAMDRDWATSEGEGKYRERRGSNVGRPRRVSVNERPRGFSVNEYERSRKISGTPYDYERTRKTSGTPYPAPGYAGGAAYSGHAPPSPGRPGYSDRGSPYMGGGGLPTSGGPVYPPGHIYAGKPIPGMQGDSLGNISGQYGPPSPRRSSVALDSPAGFSRPPSLAVPYTYFDPLLIMTDVNELFQRLPLMPAVLGPHDVWVEDWIRCLEDMTRAWTGQLAMRERQKSIKNYSMVAQLIDVWNASFFSLRGVELVLYRGRRRYSGPQAGRYDNRLGIEGESEDESDTISSVSSDSDAEERYMFYGGGHSRHGGSSNPWLADSREARHERKIEKRKLREKKRKRRERERERERGSGFRLFLICIGEGQPRLPPNSGGYQPPMHEGHHQHRMTSASGYPPQVGGFAASGF